MGTITRTYTFTDGTTADADEVNAELDNIIDEINGNLDGDNIASDSALSVASLSTSGAITSTLATGTAPFTIASTTKVTSLNADQVDGYDVTSGIADKTRHINLTAAGATVPATNGAAQAQTDGTNKSYYTLAYDKDTDEHAYWHFVVPDQYDGGNCIFNVWCKTSVTSGTVVFVIATGDIADAATFDAALGTTITFDAKTVDGTAGDLFVASKTADPGWTAGRLATIKLSRDVSEDDAAADVEVIMVEIEWEVT